jgi:ComF family protein
VWSCRQALRQAVYSPLGEQAYISIASRLERSVNSTSQSSSTNRPARKVAWGAAAAYGVSVSARFLDLLYPPTCACCLSDLETADKYFGLCGPCLTQLFPPFESACPRCGYPSPPGGRANRDDGCPHCARRKFRFDVAVAIGIYTGSLQTALLRMKHFRGQRLAAAVGRTFAARQEDQLSALQAELVVPIPSPFRRRFSQGTNSAAILARQLARRLRLPVFPGLLRWRRKVMRQHTLLPTERFQNVHGALGVSRGYDIKGAGVLIVDDILTTGATASEAARVLRKAGASRVSVAVVARVPDR